MQIMIDIPDQMYQKIKETNMVISGRRSGKTFDYILFNAINTGTPLPKGHGRLIDADALIDSLDASDRDIYCKAVIEEDAPTIIDAGKESEGSDANSN